MADAAFTARLEGLGVEYEMHRDAFLDAAVSCIHDREMDIRRKYPQFYSPEQCVQAGVTAWPDDCQRLWPDRYRRWADFMDDRRRIPVRDLRARVEST